MRSKLLVAVKAKQSLSMYCSLLLSILLSFFISIVNTRFLGADDFGVLKYLHNIINFFVVIFTFGFFYTGSRLIALDENEPLKSEIYFLMYFFGVIFSSLSIVVFISMFYFFSNYLELNSVKYAVIAAPLLFCFVFQACLNNLLQGGGEIYYLSLFRFLPSLIYVLLAILFYNFFDFSIGTALILQSVGFFIPILYFFYKTKPKMYFNSNVYEMVLLENKKYGRKVYFGSLFSVGSTYLSSIVIAFYMDIKYVGYYALAVTLCAPLQMIPSIIGISYFKEFTSFTSIPKKIRFLTIGLSILSLLVFLLIIEYVVFKLYGDEYRVSVVMLCEIMCLGYCFYGLGDFFSKFLSAKGYGKYLMDISLVVGMSNVIGFLVLIKFFGVLGAAFTMVLAGALYFTLMYVRYFQVVSGRNKENV